MNPRKTTITILGILSASLTLADDFKTVNGKEYKNATVSRVEPDGVVLKSKSGISKVYFVESPKDVQERFHDAAQLARALDTKTPADLMKQAESALQGNNFAYTAALFNQITEEYPASPQAKTVRELYSFLRDKQARQDGPFTAIEAQRLRSVMDAIVSIKRNHRTARPQKRAAMETLLGTEIFQDENNGLDSVSAAGAKLRDAKGKALQGQ
ncbi:MAG: hypothetical protein DME59_21150 [Verrucomicrobia bacterium]|nr:MAG: hypothetical protein DME59_21150 [Verrucomicrobiota bacterium]